MKITKANQSPTALIMDVAKQAISQNKAELKDERYVANLVGTESYETFGQQRETKSTNMTNMLTQQLVAEKVLRTATDLTPAQTEAANIVLLAAGNPSKYARAAMSEEYAPIGNESIDAPMAVSGPFGTMDVLGKAAIGLEYFNDVALDTHLAASVAFNMQAARQSPFCEAFFRTVTIDPSECGMLIEINKTMVFRSVRHAMHDKDSKDYERRNILDAATDSTVLEDHSVTFVPFMNPDASNDRFFVEPALLEPEMRELESTHIRTSALKFGDEELKLLRLSAHPGLVTSGILDESDEFDGRFAIENLYFLIKKKGEADSQGRLVRRSVHNLPRSSFNKSQEGDMREMVLDFKGSSFTFDKSSKSVGNGQIPALADLFDKNYSLKITTRVHGDVNLQTGHCVMDAGKANILSLINEAGHTVSVSEGAGADLVKDLVITTYGYDLKATRSNSNRRSKGLLVDEVGQHERYKIQLGSPITSRKPIGRTDNAAQVTNLITVARQRNDNLGITKLLNYTELLEEVVKGITPENEYDLVSIEGAGRHYIRPWFERATFDVESRVAALQSDDVPNALRAALLTNLRDQVVRAFQQSRFQPALEMLSGYTMSRPKVTIGTDIITANWLWEKGDLRTMGDAFEYCIVTTTDKRFTGRLQWVFTVGEEGFHVLNFGNFLWVPELVTDTNLTRNDAVANEITVQPRCYHVVNCPITGVIDVIGLSDYVQGKPSIAVTGLSDMSAGITDPIIDGADPQP